MNTYVCMGIFLEYKLSLASGYRLLDAVRPENGVLRALAKTKDVIGQVKTKNG